MSKRALTPVISRAELARIVPPEKLGPDSPLHKIQKPRTKKGEPEHEAQVRFFEKIDTSEDMLIARYAPVIHAIPQFTDRMQSWRQQKTGERYKAEGQRKGMPDIHVPVSRLVGGYGGYDALSVASLYVELKFESYPSASQRIMFPKLAEAGNAVVTIRFPSINDLASFAYECVLEYLYGNQHFSKHGHPKFTYLPT